MARIASPLRQHHASWSDRMAAACAATSATRGRPAGSMSKQAATSCLTLAGQPNAASSGQLKRPLQQRGQDMPQGLHAKLPAALPAMLALKACLHLCHAGELAMTPHKAQNNASVAGAPPAHLTTASIRLPPASPAARSKGLCPHTRK